MQRMENYVSPYMLFHYGVKGMKWGVRRTREQLGHQKKKIANLQESDTIKKKNPVQEAIDGGKVSTKVNREKQTRHIRDGETYIEKRSYMYGTIEDVQAFIDMYAGKGKALLSKSGVWINKERIDANKMIGKRVGPITGEETETNKAMIVYSKTGSHAYPRKEE